MSASVTEEFGQLTAPFRRELLVHCYRMLGSVHDAEDTVQETYLRAWRAFDKFEGRSSLRTWLHRIATTACLSALQNRNRRPLPSGLGSSCDPGDALVERPEIPWLEPLPDTVDGDPGTDPGAVVELRKSTRLAFIVALQHLSPRQRAVLILRDVLSWKASEVAEAVGVSTAAVNSMLQRARTQVRRATSPPGIAPAALSVQQRQLLDRYVEAFEAKDVAALQELFTSDAVWEMPPFLNWVRGASRISRLVDLQCPAGPGDMRLLPTSANGQRAFAVYLRGAGGGFHPFQLQVLELRGPAVEHVVAFFDLRLFESFRLPEALRAS